MPSDDNGFDLRKYALQVLEVAKQNLIADGFLEPVAFLVKPDEVEVVDASFRDESEKTAKYGEIVSIARQHHAAAIITVNDARFGSPGRDMDGYYWGKLAAEEAPECIYLTVSGPAIRTWEVTLPYRRSPAGIVFDKALEEYDTELSFLPGWASSKRNPS